MADAKTATHATVEEAPDGRVVNLVVAMVPAPGEVEPTPDQKKLALQIGKLITDAQKAAADKAAKPDQADLTTAEVKFFSGDLADLAAKKKAEQAAAHAAK